MAITTAPDSILTCINQRDQSHPLYRSHREKIKSVPERNHQQVPIAHRVTIPSCIAQFIPGYDLIRHGIAERASHGSMHPHGTSAGIRGLTICICYEAWPTLAEGLSPDEHQTLNNSVQLQLITTSSPTR